jgi:bzd-type benzoyl-CoA reductase N subunit
MTILEEFTNISSSLPNSAINDWKSSGKKVVGFFCSYVPEEILYAADILPIRVRAPKCTDISAADTYMSHLNCTFMRSCLQFALDGKYKFLDGLVFTNSCDHVRRLYDILREVRPNDYPLLHLISVPHKVDEDLIAWFKGELIDFKRTVEISFGVKITDARLRDAIGVYNETRVLLKKLYDLRKAEMPPISGAQSLAVAVASGSMPKDQFNILMRKLLDELSKREGISGYRGRLMLAGSGGCDNPDYIKVMEDIGALVVTDSLCFGSRYFWSPVEDDGDLLLNLARSYLNRPSCPRMVDNVSERCNFVKQMVDDFNVDGVVFQRIRYCDLWGGQLLHLQKELNKSKIPLLSLEREYSLGAVGQLKTRIQAFLERIERKE